MKLARAVLAVPLLLAAGCDGPGAASPAEPAPVGVVDAASPTAAKGASSAHDLVIIAASCWFGGLWSDALGATAETRRGSAERRCTVAVEAILGAPDKAKYDLLRSLEPATVTRARKEIGARGGDNADAAMKLFDALVAAQREENDAHLYADAVKQDLKSGALTKAGAEPVELTKDELAAVKPLRTHAALDALFALDAGALTQEARFFALLTAMDRMELARGLPKHLKAYAVADAFALVFGVKPPDVPANVTTHLTPGLWLSYMTDVAAKAGHPVPAAATIPREREPWAWGGALEGFADKTREVTPKLAPGSEIAKVAAAVTKRLDDEWAQIPAMAADEKGIYEREKAGTLPPPGKR